MDVSGNYTEDQLRLNEFKYPDMVQMLSVRNAPLYWLFPCDSQEKFSESLTDFLVEALKLQSFRQEDLLAEVDLDSLQYIMGHEEYKMISRIYDNVTQERVREQLKKLDSNRFRVG